MKNKVKHLKSHVKLNFKKAHPTDLLCSSNNKLQYKIGINKPQAWPQTAIPVPLEAIGKVLPGFNISRPMSNVFKEKPANSTKPYVVPHA